MAVVAIAAGMAGSLLWPTLFTVPVAIVLWRDIQTERKRCLACIREVEAVELPLADLRHRRVLLEAKLNAAETRLAAATKSASSLEAEWQKNAKGTVIESSTSEASVNHSESPALGRAYQGVRRPPRLDSMRALQKVELGHLRQSCEALAVCVRWAHHQPPCLEQPSRGAAASSKVPLVPESSGAPQPAHVPEDRQHEDMAERRVRFHSAPAKTHSAEFKVPCIDVEHGTASQCRQDSASVFPEQEAAAVQSNEEVLGPHSVEELTAAESKELVTEVRELLTAAESKEEALAAATEDGGAEGASEGAPSPEGGGNVDQGRHDDSRPEVSEEKESEGAEQQMPIVAAVEAGQDEEFIRRGSMLSMSSYGSWCDHVPQEASIGPLIALHHTSSPPLMSPSLNRCSSPSIAVSPLALTVAAPPRSTVSSAAASPVMSQNGSPMRSSLGMPASPIVARTESPMPLPLGPEDLSAAAFDLPAQPSSWSSSAQSAHLLAVPSASYGSSNARDEITSPRISPRITGPRAADCMLQPVQRDSDPEPELEPEDADVFDLDGELHSRSRAALGQPSERSRESAGTDRSRESNEDTETCVEVPLLRPTSRGTADEGRIARQFDIRGLGPVIESEQVTQQCTLGPRLTRSRSEDGDERPRLDSEVLSSVLEWGENIQGTVETGLESFKGVMSRHFSIG